MAFIYLHVSHVGTFTANPFSEESKEALLLVNLDVCLLGGLQITSVSFFIYLLHEGSQQCAPDAFALIRVVNTQQIQMVVPIHILIEVE